VRSGLVETYHDGAVAVCGPSGELIAWSGDIDRPYFLRSSAKPFQALASQMSGAALEPLELALASGSHRGHPAQVAIVASMLASAGLGEEDLGCPADWPLSPTAARRLQREHSEPRPLWQNCSGKHAGFLRACVASGLPIDGYLDPKNPVQERALELISQLGRFDAGPVGVDGCGAPVARTTARAMATLFAGLASDPSAAEVFGVMRRYPAMVSGNGEADTSIAIAIGGAAKGGAQGCIGIALPSGIGVAVKSWDGLGEMAVVGAIAALDALGALTPTARQRLANKARPVVLGGGAPVGEVEPRLELAFEVAKNGARKL
jgi:L-asparaginase II